MSKLLCVAAALVLLAAASSRSQAGLTRHDVLVIANSNSATSQAVANYYAAKRSVPASRVRQIACPTGDSVSPAQLESIRDQIRSHLISLGSQPESPETDPTKAIVLTYDIPHYVSDGGEVYASVDASLTAMCSESPWGKDPVGVYGYYHPVPGALNAYYGDYSAPMSFEEFRSNAAASTYYEAFPKLGFTKVRMLSGDTALAIGGGGILYRGVLSGGQWAWSPVPGKDKGSIGWNVSHVSVLDSSRAFACTGNASKPHGGGTIIVSTNGGQTWTKVRGSSRTSGYKLGQALLGIDYADTTRGWAVGTSLLAGGSVTPYMIRTVNGTTWTDISAKLPSGFTPRAVAAADANNVWICGAGGAIYRSTDAGETWSPANTGAPNVTYTAIWIRLDGATPKGWAAGASGTIIRTENGTNWTQEAAGLTSSHITDLAVFDQDHACASYGADSFLTFTRGSGWRVENTGLAPMVSAASADGSSFVSVGSTRYIFGNPTGSWACGYTGTDTAWRLRYLVTRLDGFFYDTSPADGIPDDICAMIDRGAAANAPGKFVIDEATLYNGYTMTPTFFSSTYNALLPIVGSSGITYDQTSVYLTGQSNVMGYTSHGLHDSYADSYTSWGRTFNTWANGGVATVVESTDGRSFDRPRYAWGLSASGTVYANKLRATGFKTGAQYTGYRLVLHGSNGAELASSTFVSGQAEIDLSTVSWPADNISYATIRFPDNDPLNPGHIVYDAYYPSLTGNTTIYNNRATGVSLSASPIRTLMASTIREGASGGIANVDEPWASYAGQPQHMFPRYAQGYTWAESAYTGLPGIGWQEVVLGDPLMAPFATPPVVTITAPSQDGSLVQGIVRLAATAVPVNAAGIQRVEFRLDDDTLLATLTAAPYEIDLDTVARGISDGLHAVEVIAYESGSVQETGCSTRTIFVNNTCTPLARIGDALSQPEGTKVMLEGKTVSAVFGQAFYIEELDRTQGLRVISDVPVTEGGAVTVIGIIRTTDGEREILADGVSVSH